jgi:hypothetical protein
MLALEAFRLLAVSEYGGTTRHGWSAPALVVAALDPFRGDKTALEARLSDATVVLDAFHVTRPGLTALHEVRRRVP